MTMRYVGLLVATVLLGCSPSRAFRNDVNATSTISEAERFITDAQQAGADSLAAEPLAAAQRAVQTAREFAQQGQSGRAHLEALKAQAEARYARAAAERERAQRQRAQARAAYDALPPQGGAR